MLSSACTYYSVSHYAKEREIKGKRVNAPLMLRKLHLFAYSLRPTYMDKVDKQNKPASDDGLAVVAIAWWGVRSFNQGQGSTSNSLLKTATA
jgi:hypothetical protein